MLYRIVDVRPGSDYRTTMTDIPTSQGSSLSDEPRPSQRRVSTVPRIDSIDFNRLGLFLLFSSLLWLLAIYLFRLVLQRLSNICGSSIFPCLDKSLNPCSACVPFFIFANFNAADVYQEIQRVRASLRLLAELFEPR